MPGNGTVEEEPTKAPLLDYSPATVRSKHEGGDHGDLDLTRRVWIESKKLWHIVGPSMISRIASYSMFVITQAFAGHLGDHELAAVSIASNVVIGFNFGLLLGMASALETLCGQAFGAKKYHMLGIYMQRSWIVLFICCILLLPLYIFASPILKLVGQPASLSDLSGVVSLYMIPLHFSFAFQFPLQRFLQSQLKTAAIAWVSMAALAVHVLVSWLFVYRMRLGLVGVAVTLNFSWWILVLGMFGYTVLGGCPLTWTGFSVEAFSGLGEFVSLSVASGVMLCLENWYYRILILMTGNLKNAEIAVDALSICMNINGWEMMIPLAFFAGTGVRVANELGAGNGKGAKFATIVSVVTSVVIGLFFWLLIMIFHNEIALIFSSSKPVLEAVNTLSLLLAFTILLNSVQPVLSGVAVGSGWQSYVAYINLGCYYVIGVPLGFVMGWVFNQGVMGIWAGMIFGGTAVQTLILVIITLKCDWEKEVVSSPSLHHPTTQNKMPSNGTVKEPNKVPLLGNSSTSVVRSKYEDDQDLGLTRRVWIESNKLWHIVGPSMVSRIASYSTFVITQAFAGHLGDHELAAVSIANNVIIGLTFGLLLGMASALETLCGQAFGAKKYHMLGIYMQRSWIVLFLCCILLLPLFLFASPILKLLGQPPSIADLSGVVSLYLIPLHFSFAFQFPLQRFLQSQLKTAAIAWAAVAGLAVHVLVSWLFVYRMKLGLVGVTVTLNFSWWVLVLVLFGYTVFGGCPTTWTGFSIEAFSGLGEFVRLSASSGVMLCLENWYYRVLILMTGNLKNAEVAVDALSICMNINGWEMMIPLAFFAGTGVRVANELGAGNGKGAKFATIVSVMTSVVIGLFFWLLILIFHNEIALIFSSSKPVLEAVNTLSVLLAFTVLLNSVQPVLSGVAVGSGWQSYVAYINLGCYYLVGAPLGFVMGWVFNQGVMGIWAGMIFGGTAVQTLILAIITMRCDWEKEAEKATAHVMMWADR